MQFSKLVGTALFVSFALAAPIAQDYGYGNSAGGSDSTPSVSAGGDAPAPSGGSPAPAGPSVEVPSATPSGGASGEDDDSGKSFSSFIHNFSTVAHSRGSPYSRRKRQRFRIGNRWW